MDQRAFRTINTHRDRWLALLDKNGVGHPKVLRAMEVPGGIVQTTLGEPPGQIRLDGAPANVLMFNLSPVQALRQAREGRSIRERYAPRRDDAHAVRHTESSGPGTAPATGWM